MEKWSTLRSEYDFHRYLDLPSIYLIASTPRSGSHYLAHLLISSQLLGAPLEYFHSQELIAWKKYFNCDDQCELFRKLFFMRTSPNGWFGIKSHWSQYEPILKNKNLVNLLSIKKYIYINRNDLLAQAISFEIASQTNSWISFQNKTCEPLYQFDSIYNRILDLKSEKHNWDKFFIKNEISPIYICYEDLLDKPQLSVKTIFKEFNLPHTGINLDFAHMPKKQITSINSDWKERFIGEAKSKRGIDHALFLQ